MTKGEEDTWVAVRVKLPSKRRNIAQAMVTGAETKLKEDTWSEENSAAMYIFDKVFASFDI